MAHSRTFRVLFVGSLLTVCPSAAVAMTLEDDQERGRGVEYWVNQLRNDGLSDKRTAAIELGRLGPAAKDAVPLLIERFRHGVPMAVRWQRCGDGGAELYSNALVKIGADAVPPLIRAIGNADADTRAAAAYTLGKFKEAATSAIPALTKALNDPIPFVRIASASAHWKIAQKSEAAVPVLVGVLDV